MNYAELLEANVRENEDLKILAILRECKTLEDAIIQIEARLRT